MGDKTDSLAAKPLSGEHVIVSVNPKAGAGCSRSRAQQLVEILSEKGLKVRIETDLDRVENEACHLAKEGKLRALVGVGGDGTATELANRITPEVPLVMLRGGTENLLARHIGWPKSPKRLAKVIIDGRKIRIDVGLAGNRRFLLMLSCGIDADAVQRLDEGRSGHISHASYMGPVFKSVCHYKYPKIEVNYGDQAKWGEYEGQESRKDGNFQAFSEADCGTIVKNAGPSTATPDNKSIATWVVISNISLYGGGVRFSPEADETDGFLDVCEFRGVGFFRSLWFFTMARLGRSEKLKSCSARQAVRIRLTAEEPLPYQIDGDPGGTLPVEIKIIPQALTLLVS